MSAKGIWFGNESWPSGRSPGDFARDVFRLEGCRTDKEKALAFYKWMIRCVNRGPNLYLASGSGTYQRCFHAGVLFTSWGSHECTGWGWMAAEALCGAGMKARRVCCHNNGHTIYEVWYKGDDGVEGWHAFDAFAGWYVLNAKGEVASCRELAADSNLVQNPYPGHSLPCGHVWEKSGIGHRHRMEDALEIVTQVRNERLSWDLMPGQAASSLWRPADPEYALITYDESPPGERGRHFADGSHCSITPYDHEGKLRYPEHEPHWKPYRWPASRDGRSPVRWHGYGSLRWKPLAWGEAVAERTCHAKFENGRLSPDGPNRFLEVWYRFRLPYLVSHIAIDADVAGAGTVGFQASADEGETLWPIYWGPPKYGVFVNGKADYIAGRPSVQGLREFLLRIDMETRSEIRMNALRIMIGYQHNMHVQPRLVPGANLLHLCAHEIAGGHRLRAKWNCTAPGGEREEALTIEKAGRTERAVEIPVAKPEDIVMRGVTIECE